MTQQLRSTRPANPMGSDSARMTYKQFLERDGIDNHVEWVDGELVMMAPISDEQ